MSEFETHDKQDSTTGSIRHQGDTNSFDEARLPVAVPSPFKSYSEFLSIGPDFDLHRVKPNKDTRVYTIPCAHSGYYAPDIIENIEEAMRLRQTDLSEVTVLVERFGGLTKEQRITYEQKLNRDLLTPCSNRDYETWQKLKKNRSLFAKYGQEANDQFFMVMIFGLHILRDALKIPVQLKFIDVPEGPYSNHIEQQFSKEKPRLATFLNSPALPFDTRGDGQLGDFSGKAQLAANLYEAVDSELARLSSIISPHRNFNMACSSEIICRNTSDPRHLTVVIFGALHAAVTYAHYLNPFIDHVAHQYVSMPKKFLQEMPEWLRFSPGSLEDRAYAEYAQTGRLTVVSHLSLVASRVLENYISPLVWGYSERFSATGKSYYLEEEVIECIASNIAECIDVDSLRKICDAPLFARDFAHPFNRAPSVLDCMLSEAITWLNSHNERIAKIDHYQEPVTLMDTLCDIFIVQRR